MMQLKRSESVFENLDLVGDWWFPEDPSKTVRGHMSGCAADEFILRVDGSLEEFHSARPDRIILGHTRDYEDVTLLQSWLKQTNGQESTYFVHWALIGAHFSTTDSLRFHRLRFGVHLLDEWHNAHSFSHLGLDNDGTRVLRYRPPERIALAEQGQITVYLDYDLGPEQYTAVQKEFTIAHAARLEMTVDPGEAPLALFGRDSADGSLMDKVQSLCAFFSVATSAQVFPYDLTAYSPKICGTFPGGSSHEKAVRIYRLWQVPKALPLRQPWDMEFTWEHVKDDPQRYFGAWLSKAHKIGMPVWLYIDAVCRKRTYYSDAYIILVQALEGYHRYAYPDASRATNDHSNRLQDIYESVPSKHLDWLKEQLRYSHEPRLARRLKDLFRGQKEATVWLLGAWKYVDAWIQAIRVTRNTHAHCLPDEIETVFAAHPRSRRREMTLMQAIMFRYLLKECQFDDNLALRILKKNRDFRSLAEYGHRELRVTGKRKHWSAVVQGADSVVFQSSSKEEVILRGKAIAQKNGYNFVIERQDGTVQCSRDYRRPEHVEASEG